MCKQNFLFIKILFHHLKSVLGIFFFITIYLGHAQNNKDKLLQQKQKIENEIKYTNSLLEESKKTRQISVNQINLLNRQILSQKELILVITSEVDDINKEITTLNRSLGSLETEIKTLKNEYAKMIYFSYLTRNHYDRLMYIFASKNMNEAFLRMQYLQEYSNSRRRQAALILSKQKELHEKLIRLKIIQNKKFELLKDQEQKNSQLEVQKKEKDKQVEGLKTKEKQLLAEIKKKQENAIKLQKEIETLIRKEIEESKKKTEAKKVEGTSIALTNAEIETSKGFAGNKGKLPWPVDKGVLSGKFGEYPHPVLPGIKIRNNGIDITTSKNLQAKAVFEGNVSAVMTLPNGTLAVIIRHGEYLTVYSNLVSTLVKKGEKVKVNQALGTISDDESNGTVLHFEVWNEKTQENPERWLKAK